EMRMDLADRPPSTAASPADNQAFDPRSGTLLERLIFNYRPVIIAACVLITALLGFQATRLVINANFERLIPQNHRYIKNYRENRKPLAALGNSIRVVVENKSGTIFDKDYLFALRDVNDTIFFIPGVDRPFMKSLWTPLVRWTEVTEQGFQGGPVMPVTFNGSPQSVEDLKVNVSRAQIAGTLVADDIKSSMIFVPLLARVPETDKPIDYRTLWKTLEEKV